MKKKVLFLIHDLGQGGAEKVLVNLVNNIDQDKFDITVMSLFGGGVNEQFLKKSIRYIAVFRKAIRGNSVLMKFFSPEFLHNIFIKEQYDVEISYLEGATARIISGCTCPNTKLISWIHVEQHNLQTASYAFRNVKEAQKCYSRFARHIFVADSVREDFVSLFPQTSPCEVLYNTVESESIIRQSKEKAEEIKDDGSTKLVATGTLKKVKGFDRLLHIVNRLKLDGYKIHLYLLGKGQMRDELERYVKDNDLEKQVTFLGYQTNPYKFVSKCDLFVCSSFAEGFSTAATEALIVGTPVCTVEVSGMYEMLGHDEYGVVTENNEEALYIGIKRLLDDKNLLNHYKEQAFLRGKTFSTDSTVRAVENMIANI